MFNTVESFPRHPCISVHSCCLVLRSIVVDVLVTLSLIACTKLLLEWDDKERDFCEVSKSVKD